MARRVTALIESGPDLDRLFSTARDQRLELPSRAALEAIVADVEVSTRERGGRER
jgi:hypothetical protein